MRDVSQAWKTLKRRLLHDGSPWLRLYAETVETPQGRRVDNFHQLESPDFSLTAACRADGHFIMLEQYRHGPRRTVLSMPGGHIDASENPEQAAERELLEETGYKAGRMSALGRFCLHPNFGLGWGNFFTALDCERTQEPVHDALEQITVVHLSAENLAEALYDGRIATMHDALCVSLALTHTNPKVLQEASRS